MFEKRCSEGGKTHKFEPRYDEKPSGVHFSHIRGYDMEELRSLYFYNVYIRDICTWCGKIIER